MFSDPTQGFNSADKVASINHALNNNPGLSNSPQLASDVVRSDNPELSAQIITHSARMSAFQSAWQNISHDATTWYDGLKAGASKGLDALNKPLQEVQADYRYVHSLYTRHGVIWGTLGAAAVAGGAALGSFAGPEGTVLGGELVASGLRHIGGHLSMFKNSYADSQNPNYEVSMGRDTANLVGKLFGDQSNVATNSFGWKSVLSGIVDGTFDWEADPLMVAGKARAAVKEGKYISQTANDVPILFRSAGVQDFFARNGLHFTNADNLDKLKAAMDNPTLADKFMGSASNVKRAYEEISKLRTSGEIVTKFPKLQTIAPELADALTVDEVHNVFLRTMKEGELFDRFATAGNPIIPSRTVVRSAVSKMADKLRQPGFGNLDDAAFDRNNAANFFLPRKVGSGLSETGQQETRWIAPLLLNPTPSTFSTAIAKKVATFSNYSPIASDKILSKLSNTEFDPTDPTTFKNVYYVARNGMGHKLAQNMVTNYINSGSFEKGRFVPGPETKNLWLSIQSEALNAMGFPNDPSVISNTLESLAQSASKTVGGQIFGYGHELGVRASEVATESGSEHMALRPDQIGKWAYPDFNAFATAARNMTTWGRLYGNLEGGIDKYFMTAFFKKAATSTAGFAQRVASNELVTHLIHNGVANTAYDAIVSAAGKMRYNLDEFEKQDILAHGILANSGNHIDYTDAEKTAKAIQNVADGFFYRNIAPTTIKAVERFIPAKKIERAAALAMATGGHMATGITMAGHGTITDIGEKEAQLVDLAEQYVGKDFTRDAAGKKVIFDPSGKYRLYSPIDHHQDFFWATELSKSAVDTRSRLMAKDFLDNLKAMKYDASKHVKAMETTVQNAWEKVRLQENARFNNVSFDPLHPEGLGQPLPKSADVYAAERNLGFQRDVNLDSMRNAYARQDAFRNLVTGQDGTVHLDLLDKIAKGEKPSLNDINKIEESSKPSHVPGQELVPYTGNVFNRFIALQHKVIIDPLINHISREPMYFQHFNKAMDHYEQLVDQGIIDYQSAVQLSQTQATKTMIPFIHNLALRSQMANLSRTIFPFYFAQEQAMKRFGSALAMHTLRSIRAAQLIEHGLSNSGFINQDSNGNKYITLPGVGEFSISLQTMSRKLGIPMVSGLPMDAEGNLSSLSTVLPDFQVKAGPVASIPLNALSSLFPGMNVPVKRLVGSQGFQQNVIDSLIPSSWMRTAFKDLAFEDKSTNFYNAVIASYQSAIAHHSDQLPTEGASDHEKQNFLEMIKNNARSTLMIKAIVGYWSPLAPKLVQKDPGVSQEFQKYLAATSNNYGQAFNNWVADKGISYASYTIAAEKASTKGLTIPSTKQAFQWLNDNKQLINSNEYNAAAPYLIPLDPGTKEDQQIMNNEMVTMGLREKRQPEEFLNAYYISAGNYEYYAALKQHNDEIKALGDNGNAVAEQNAHWKQWTQDFALAHPIWNADHTDSSRKDHAQTVLDQFAKMGSYGQDANGAPKFNFNGDIVKPTQQSQKIETLMGMYMVHLVRQQQIKNFNAGLTLSDENTAWDNLLVNVANQDHTLTSVINGVFRKVK